MNLSANAAGGIAQLLRDAARAEIMPRFRRLAAGDVRTKTGPLDIVTEADEAAERQITRELQARFPGCVVVGEEATAADPGLLDRLADADLAFVVDPVDGTSNFAAGLPLFGTMAAAFRRGEVIGAWIHDPLGDDTAVALRGEGAWIEGPDGARGQAMQVAAPVEVERMVASVSWTYLPGEMRAVVATRLPRFASITQFRCAAHDYRLLATGHIDLSFYNRLMPWDHAPGWLLHREAGGYSAQFDGRAYDPARVRDGGLINAPDRASWEAAREALIGAA
ncbi:inositol monophosphatase family protein [Roseomonas elaeocarpi]|uniref:Inositol monophosphatase family protein n=1 Tax=Roseomonas elaeocarpi TaxID=907779 RepID=A0ABV6JXV2_9PROT